MTLDGVARMSIHARILPDVGTDGIAVVNTLNRAMFGGNFAHITFVGIAEKEGRASFAVIIIAALEDLPEFVNCLLGGTAEKIKKSVLGLSRPFFAAFKKAVVKMTTA